MLAHLGQEYGPYGFEQLRQMALTGQLKGDAQPARPGRRRLVPGQAAPRPVLEPRVADHRAALRLPRQLRRGPVLPRLHRLGILKLITLGGCGIWHLIDLILMLLRKVPDAEGRPLA